MEYQNYQLRSFDDDASEEREGQLQVQSRESSFDTPQYESSESGAGFQQDNAQQEATTDITDFASIKFQRENTLLTNAERYADSIREEAELYVRQLQQEIESLNEQADKRYEEARLVKEEAEAEAERRIQDAEGRIEEIRAQGHNEGYEAGFEEGLKKRYKEAGAYLANIEEILSDLSQYRRQVDYFMEKDGVRLAVMMAKKILQQELKINKKAVWKLLASTLAGMEGTGNLRIWLNPEDFEFATAARPSLEKFINEEQTLSFRARPDLPPGNAMIETDREVIDLTLASQFRHLDQVLYQSLAESETRAMNLPPEMKAAQKPAESSTATGQEAPPAEAASQTGAMDEFVDESVAEPGESDPVSSEPVSSETAAPETRASAEMIDPLHAVGQAAQALESVEGQAPVTVSEIMPEGDLGDPAADSPESTVDSPGSTANAPEGDLGGTAEEGGSTSPLDADGAADE